MNHHLNLVIAGCGLVVGMIVWWAWMLIHIETGWAERTALWILSVGLVSLGSFYIGETVVSHFL